MTPDPAQQLAPGTSLGAYEIVDVLGRGGMATVYRARQESLGRFVALKVLAPELAANPEFVERFRREATTAANLEHIHIVPIYDVGQSDGWQYIAMRFVAGGTLSQFLQRNPSLPIATSLALLGQLAGALDYAHAHGVVHRDLKPANVLVSPSGDHASLTDFGIARAGEVSRLTRVGTIAGTPEYMSPEQAQGKPVDARSDLYALGIVAFETFAGRVPFAADSGIVVLHEQIYDPPPPLRGLRPDVPRSVESAVSHMLAKQADRRFASAEAFMTAMTSGTTHAGLVMTSSAPNPRINSVGRPAGRWLVPTALGLVGVGLLASILLLAPRDPDQTSRETPPVPQAVAVVTTATSVRPTLQPTPTRGATPTLVVSPTAFPSPTSVPSPTAPPSLNTPVPDQQGMLVVDKQYGAVVRTSPSSDASVVVSVGCGATLQVLSDQSNGWFRVRWGNVDGWVGSARVEPGTFAGASVCVGAPNPPYALGEAVIAKVPSGCLSVRSSPSTNAAVSGCVANGHIFRLTNGPIEVVGEDWYGVRSTSIGLSGWTRAAYLVR